MTVNHHFLPLAGSQTVITSPTGYWVVEHMAKFLDDLTDTDKQLRDLVTENRSTKIACMGGAYN